MNIKNFTIKNAKSFGEEVSIDFQDNLNIFIGPNAGGKSNLMDILNIVLSHFFIYTWRINTELDNETGFITRQYFHNRRDQIFNPINRFLDKHNKRLNEEQEIKISFTLELEDIKNIKILLENLEKLISFEDKNYKSGYVKTLNESLKDFNIETLKDKTLEYTIRNYNLDHKNIDQKIFLEYLNNFDLYSLLINEYNKTVRDEEKIQQLFTPLVYFSPYRNPSIRNLVINIAGANYFDLIERYKKSDSKNISSTFEVATYYFASKFLHAKDDDEIFRKNDEIKFIKEYLERLGYGDFTFRLANQPESREKNIYEAILIKNSGEIIEISKASSGEKEILNLLLGVFAFNIKNGVVIVDEPDLHLHPKWQHLLLELFYDLSIKRGVQFFLVTHSPHFITQKSIKNVLRVFAKEGESQVVPPPTLRESEKDLFQIINVFNNTKIFFADKVILVEGDTDNIIYDSILKSLQTEITKTEPTNINKIEDRNKIEIIEILDVRGNENFDKFKGFLNKWEIKSYIISDLDYLMKIGDETIKNLLEVDYKKMDDSLKKKTSKNGKTLLGQLDELLAKPQISKGDFIPFQELLDYLKSRYVKFKEDLSEEERKNINEFIEKKYKEKIYILKKGEIEDYFDDGHFNINNAIQIAKKIENKEIEMPKELENIIKKIIED